MLSPESFPGRKIIEIKGTSRAHTKKVCLKVVCQQFRQVRVSRKLKKIRVKRLKREDLLNCNIRTVSVLCPYYFRTISVLYPRATQNEYRGALFKILTKIPYVFRVLLESWTATPLISHHSCTNSMSLA